MKQTPTPIFSPHPIQMSHLHKAQTVKVIEKILTTAHVPRCACGKCYNERVAAGTQQEYVEHVQKAAQAVYESLEIPLPGRISPVTKIEENLIKLGDGIHKALTMEGGDTGLGFAKNLFKTVQGTSYTDKCPHTLPYYACMSCSH
jgi:hypothetical protein